MRSKHILFISHCFPWPLNAGGHIRRFYILKYLAERYDVSLVSMMMPGLEATASPLYAMCHDVLAIDSHAIIPSARKLRFSHFGPFLSRMRNMFTWGMSNEAGVWTCPEIVKKFRKLGDIVDPDVTWVDRSFVAEGLRAAGFRNLVVDVDDVLTGIERQRLAQSGWYKSKPFHYAELLKLSHYERTLAARFTGVVVCKAEDKHLVGGPSENVFVVPNGTSEVECANPALEDTRTILFVGTLDYGPNQDAVFYFVRDILPQIKKVLANVRFLIVGREPTEAIIAMARNRLVEVHGNVPSVRPYYERATIVVSPLRIGSGTKLKVLEALAHGKALIATAHSIEGLDLRRGIDFELANNPTTFAESCIGLLENRNRRESLGNCGRARVRGRYGWESAGLAAEHALGLKSATADYDRRHLKLSAIY